MNNIKERNYMFDTFRGLLILLIPVSHFTRMSGSLYSKLYLSGHGFPQASLDGFVYITINVFVMQAFMFLSGYFSKNTQRARETSFNTFLWPYLVFTCIYFVIRHLLFGGANLKFLTPPFALWFLFVVFFYRFFLEKAVKIPNLLALSLLLFLFAGQIEWWDSFFALGRMFSYLPFFLLGFYCSEDTLMRCATLIKRKLVLVLLGGFLVLMSVLLAFYGPKVGWYLLKSPVSCFGGMMWYEDILFRVLVLCLACGWILFILNILPSKQNLLSYVGVHTMPVYIFHLTLRYIIEVYGLYIGFISCLIVAWFGLLSLVHKRLKKRKLYAAAIIISIAIVYVLCSSGLLHGLYGLCPENIFYYHLLVYGGALLSVFAFVCTLWIKVYDLLTNGGGKTSLINTLKRKANLAP